MLKKIILGVALAVGLATVSVASILLDIGANEQGVVLQPRDLPDQTPASAI